MKIKHTLASSKDKKPTIRTSELTKLINCENLNEIQLSYGSYNLTYSKSRGGETFYCTTIPPHKFLMPLVGQPVYHKVELSNNTQGDLFKKEFEPIRTWADNKGIYKSGDAKSQCIKLYEEVGELSRAILKDDEEEIIDAIGDCVIVLTSLCELCDLYKESKTNIGLIDKIHIEDCINRAYQVIKNRTGKMHNGTFVKNN
jgi:NTP pyrophosphatase (non-canonical NTP hydrolase)